MKTIFSILSIAEHCRQEEWEGFEVNSAGGIVCLFLSHHPNAARCRCNLCFKICTNFSRAVRLCAAVLFWEMVRNTEHLFATGNVTVFNSSFPTLLVPKPLFQALMPELNS